ncbi:MAG TPA: glycerate kinase [Nitrospirae bacterium]|nr:putative hydroxypyruvate reductase [bacterium BMS3Abin06]HDH13129.1 glycerate kinase [Nitrospirota bacterium]HDZ03315.1 glycerate kinase [Nitrospirota bacterium]
MTKAKESVNKIFLEALRSVDPSLIVKDHAKRIHSDFSGTDFKKLLVTGFGKASYQMAKAVEDVFDASLITGGIVITKYGHAERQGAGGRGHGTWDLKKIKVFEAGHPIPDENGIMATEEIIKLLQNTDEQTLVLCLISGGGSALFVSPYEGITLSEKQLITDLLLRAGADITELNSVRKHLSGVKGGRLAEIASPAKIISLMISDVIGDKLDVIASGPTAPDTSTFNDAAGVINKFNLREKAPKGVLDIIDRGREGLIPETPKADSPVFENVTNIIIGSNRKALEAAKNKAMSIGFEAEIISSGIMGEAREVGKRLAGKAKGTKVQRHKGTKCFISGGETTVTVRGAGKGGRNTELALSFAMEIEGIGGVTLLSAGTDGTDGPTDAAGAIVDGETILKAKKLGLNPKEYLGNNDSYNFFNKINSLLITGPTGTNVMDVQIIVVE